VQPFAAPTTPVRNRFPAADVTRLGFDFNPKFTDDNAACMVVSEEAFVMLLVQPFFQTFTKREICDAEHVEALHGFMYSWSFYDLDGHGWGVLWMDPAAVA